MQLLTELTAPRETLKVPLNPQESAWVQRKHERSILQERKNNLRPQLWKWRRVQMCSIQSSPPLLEFLYNHTLDCSGLVPWVVTEVRVRSACQCYVSYTFTEVPLLYNTATVEAGVSVLRAITLGCYLLLCFESGIRGIYHPCVVSTLWVCMLVFSANTCYGHLK